MDKIQAVMNRFPQNAYDPDNQKSVLYAIIKAIIDEFNITMGNIDRINKMLDINNIEPEDMYNRFGALLNISRNPKETDEQYRNRIKTSMTALSGGTAAAIKDAIACGLGINDDNEAYFPIELNLNLLKDSLEYLNADDLYLNSDGEIIRSIRGMDTDGVNITVDKLNKMVYIDPNPKRTTPMISIPFECITKYEEINTIKL